MVSRSVLKLDEGQNADKDAQRLVVSRAPDLEECNDAHNQSASLMQRLKLIPL